VITAVETNFLVDISEPSPIHGLRSKENLRKCLREGAVVACDVVWAKAPNAYGNHASELAEALRTMRLKRLLIEKMLINDTVVDKRMNPVDRRKLNTYLEKDRRTGVVDRRAKLPEIARRFFFDFPIERRKSTSDRRMSNTYIRNDRRSGIADRRNLS